MFPVAALEAVTPESITQAVDLFEMIKQLRLKLTNINEETLDRAFENHIQNVLEKLDHKIPLLTDVQVKNVEIIMAKHGLCDATFQQVILLCQSISPILGDVLTKLRNIHAEYLSELQYISNQYMERIHEQKISENNLKTQIDNLEKECNELLSTTKLLDQEAEENNKLILDLRKQLRESLAEMNSIKASGKKSAWKANNTPNEQSRPSFDTSIQADVRGRKLFDNMKKSDPHVVNHNSSGPLSSSQLEYKPQASMSSTMSSTISPQSSLSSLSNWLLSIRKEIQTSLDSNSIRSLTLNECKDLVSSILDSRQQILQKIKQKIESTQQEIDLNGLRLLYSSHLVGGTIVSNPKIQANLSSLCPDTLEVYVYQMMEKKYGLRSLAVEHSAMLLQGVATYRQQDITIRLFDYMFRNIIEEEYRGVIDELKKSVKDLLTVGMMNKFPNKDQGTIESFVSEKMNFEEIDEGEWTSIVSYLYHSKDATTLRLLLRQEANRIREERGDIAIPLTSTSNRITPSPALSRSHTPNKRRPSSGSTPHKQKSPSNSSNESSSPNFTLPFSAFLNCVLDFQISNHIKYLEGFHHIFTSCDTDRDGLLSIDELVECFHRLRNNNSHGDEFLGDEERELFEMVKKLLDPVGTGRIPYTVMASCMNQIGKKIMNSSTITIQPTPSKSGTPGRPQRK